MVAEGGGEAGLLALTLLFCLELLKAAEDELEALRHDAFALLVDLV